MSILATATARPPRSQAWIVSAWWDLTYVVVTPLLIVPVVLILARRWLTPEEVSLGVMAFASLGHHLPGFMRAYGDRALFLRYRVRFLVVPLLVFGLALSFTPPASLRDLLHLPWHHLHGLEFVLLLWGTWHGLMQIYGFMRIYDVRLGVHDSLSARLDHWLCLAVFAAGMVFSDARVFAVANTMWQSGFPLFGPEWVVRTRWLVGSVGLGVLVAYAVNLRVRYRHGNPICWLKLLLIGITGWFYWYTGRLSTNVLIGLAMFEIFHAVQYYAIVWIYNRRLFERAGEKFGMLGFLFRDRWSMLGIYFAAIAAYSSIRYFSENNSGYVFLGGNQDSYQWLMALFVTSSMLHFYFDGFIWQVSEKKTQQNLVEHSSSMAKTERNVPRLVHAAKIGILLTLALTLVYLEQFHLSHQPRETADRLQALTRLTPNLPECQSMLCHDALRRRNAKAALDHGERALALRPRSHAVRADLGLALLLSGRPGEAKERMQEAIALRPQVAEYHSDLATIWARLGDNEKAEFELRWAIELQPQAMLPHQKLVEFLLRQNRTPDAEVEFLNLGKKFPESLAAEVYQVSALASRGEYQRAIELAYFLSIGNPGNWRVQLLLGKVLLENGDAESAVEPLENARRLAPAYAEIYYSLGRALLQSGHLDRAVGLFLKAMRIEPEHFEARFQLGTTFYLLGKHEEAIAAFEHCRKLRPNHGQLPANLGGVYAELGDFTKAEEVYRAGIAVDPDSRNLNYNLGLLLLQRGQQDEAHTLITRAAELGIKISPEVRQALGL